MIHLARNLEFAHFAAQTSAGDFDCDTLCPEMDASSTLTLFGSFSPPQKKKDRWRIGWPIGVPSFRRQDSEDLGEFSGSLHGRACEIEG